LETSAETLYRILMHRHMGPFLNRAQDDRRNTN
jgi:hypothetical protein